MAPLFIILSSTFIQTSPSLPFPISPGRGGNFPLDGLRAMDIVALVRPKGSPVEERRGDGFWSVQAFSMVGGIAPQGLLKVAIPVSTPRPDYASSAFTSPPAGTYLLLAMQPKGRRFPATYTGRGSSERMPPPELVDGLTVPALSGEVFGVALVRTGLSTLPASPTKEGTILRAIARSTGAETDSTYSALPLWNRILPFSSATWDGEDPANAPQRDSIEGMPAKDFYRNILSPLLSVPTDDPLGPRSAEAWALRTRWGVPGAADRLAKALLSTVSSGRETMLLRKDTPLDDLGNDGYRDRVGLPQSAMIELAVHAKTSSIRDLALQYVLKAPSPDEQRRLVPLLDDPNVRRRLMAKLAAWNRRPDLAPPTQEAAYEAKQAEIASTWRRLMPAATSSTKRP